MPPIPRTADSRGRTRPRELNRRDDRSRWRQQPSLLPSACLFDNFSRKERCGGRCHSPFPFPLPSSAASCGKNAAAAGARPSPSRFYPRLPPAERTLRRRAVPLALSPPSASFDSLSRKERRGGGRRLRPCAKDGTAAPGEKSTFPFTTLPAKMKKNAPPGRKTYLVTRHPPRTIKNRPPIRAKNAAPLCRTAAIKNKKTGRPIWTSCKFGCGNNLTSRGVIPKYFRRRRA